MGHGASGCQTKELNRLHPSTRALCELGSQTPRFLESMRPGQRPGLPPAPPGLPALLRVFIAHVVVSVFSFSLNQLA